MSERRDRDPIEPALGDLSKVHTSASPTGVERRRVPRDSMFSIGPPPRQTEPVRSRWPWIVGIALLFAIIAVLLLLWRVPIANRLMPAPRQAQLMRDADRALAQGKLTSSDGRGASELYAAVLALDPDRQPARDGLKRVGEAALVQARDALQRNDLARARDDLALAHRLSVPVAEIVPLEDALLRHDTAGTSIAKLLDQAAAAERAGHLDDGDGDASGSALALYQRALAADSGNAVVLVRRQALLARLLDQAGARASGGDVDAASAVIERVAAIDVANPDLPVARAQLAAARERREHGQAHALEIADSALRQGGIDAAVKEYRAVLADDANNARARAGLRSAADAYAVQASRQASEFEFARADALLAQARALAPDTPSIRTAEQHLRIARTQRSGAIPARNTQADKDRVTKLLADAQRAIDSDNLLDPPGDSAFDKLRAAAAIAPEDSGVRTMQHRFGPAAIACYRRALTVNWLGRAEGCLDAVATVQPAYPQLSSMREALAQRWLAVADERLGAGEFDAVRKALDAARRLSPHLRELPALEARLEQARAGH